MSLDPNKKLNIEEILKNLENYRAKKRGWVWRKQKPVQVLGEHTFYDHSESLKKSVPLPAAKYFDNIDPQPKPVITTEIASGRFEDDIRRMRMAAWHGADHIMVIRTTGQSHIDGLIEGTPEGIGGVPITRKQIRATRKALDLIEEEVGRPINFHSYVSGVAGPEVAVVFAEEGISGAHQDPQYNVLYRNVNMYRSFVDAAEAKKIMADANIFQIDGAHNANATAKKAWKVRPELLVQHAINSLYSVKAGMKPDNIGLSTVPPTAPPAPKLWYDLPYAVALRDLFSDYKFRAQQNTRYVESDTDEAQITHAVDTLISALTSADIQSTITPDEGRNVPWHQNNIRAVDATKQVFNALDGIKQLVKLDMDGPLGKMVRELKERAVLFLEEILDVGGYFNAVEKGYFVDSGYYPERNGDGIIREQDAGVAVNTIIERKADYFAPVCSHFGINHIPDNLSKPCDAIDGCTLCKPMKIAYIDELDPVDNVNTRIKQLVEDEKLGIIRPEVEWHGDGLVTVEMVLPVFEEAAEIAGLTIAKQMTLKDPQIIHKRVLHPAEGTMLLIKGKVDHYVKLSDIKIPEKVEHLSDEIIENYVKEHELKVVGATLGEDEHSVGLQEILDIKHGGIEKWGFKCYYLGTSVPVEKLVDAAIEVGAKAILASTIITHGDVHKLNMKKLDQVCREKGIRDKVLLIAGGTQVTNDMAVAAGMDAGFGRGTHGIDVADFIVKKLISKEK
ncbi:MAG: cobalamin-dependent protein [Spirochaetes bacterium]|nr:cobalamin-dependent protein [Spirochaetota bacterium]MBP8991924.1 cobalamin-dependent protein [Spirochaetota bacterium]HNV44063.1 D-ornithine 4,5-aminomutase subunit OraE [Exilispira sp.]